MRRNVTSRLEVLGFDPHVVRSGSFLCGVVFWFPPTVQKYVTKLIILYLVFRYRTKTKEEDRSRYRLIQ